MSSAASFKTAGADRREPVLHLRFEWASGVLRGLTVSSEEPSSSVTAPAEMNVIEGRARNPLANTDSVN